MIASVSACVVRNKRQSVRKQRKNQYENPHSLVDRCATAPLPRRAASLVFKHHPIGPPIFRRPLQTKTRLKKKKRRHKASTDDGGERRRTSSAQFSFPVFKLTSGASTVPSFLVPRFSPLANFSATSATSSRCAPALTSSNPGGGGGATSFVFASPSPEGGWAFVVDDIFVVKVVVLGSESALVSRAMTMMRNRIIFCSSF